MDRLEITYTTYIFKEVNYLMENGLSNSDVALLAGRNNDGIFGGDNGLVWLLAFFMFAGGGFGGFGGNRGPIDVVTSAELQASQNAQTNSIQLGQIQQALADNRYDIAQTINTQTSELVAQNNTNLINAIQGFNNLGLQITNQTNVLSQQLMGLDAKLTQCCCEIKTQMLQNRLDDAQAKNVTLQNAIDNANQSQYILSQLGRFVAWPGSGTPTTAG